MTHVACWVNGETQPAQVWAVSDSRVVVGSSVLSDSVAKLFSLPLLCRRPGASGFFDSLYFSHSVGLAVAGNAILSLNLYASLVPILSNLIGTPMNNGTISDAIPSLEDIAGLVGRLERELCLQIGATMGSRALGEALIFGHCFRTNTNRVFRLSPVENREKVPSLEIICEEQDLSAPERVVLLGVRQTEIAQRITDMRSSFPHRDIRWWRAPEFVLKRMLDDRSYDSIGGAIQRARAGAYGVNIFANVRPLEVGKPAAVMEYLGMDILHVIGAIGPCYLGLGGQA